MPDLEQAEEVVVILAAALGLLGWRCGRARETEAHQFSGSEAVRTPSDQSLLGGQNIYATCGIDGSLAKGPNSEQKLRPTLCDAGMLHILQR